MQTHVITGTNGVSQIIVGAVLRDAATYLRGRQCVIVTDEHVAPLYRDHFPPGDVVVIGSGEAIKTLNTAALVYQKFVTAELDRGAFVLAVGGGIVCDLAGFAAATYLRGIACGFVPTTLLAQVDASVGGKNGVNFEGYKNVIGTFAQPEFVLIDVNLLQTLPAATLGCGLAEAIKHGAIADRALFEFMETHAEGICQRDPACLERIVNDSIMIKAAIVNRDEKEQGERRKLNFGHTFGHAIEKTLGWPHGESVALGMVVAARLSQQRGYLSAADTTRLCNLLAAYQLPVALNADADLSRIKEALRHDKKRYGAQLKFVLLHGLGQAIIEDVTLTELENAVNC